MKSLIYLMFAGFCVLSLATFAVAEPIDVARFEGRSSVASAFSYFRENDTLVEPRTLLDRSDGIILDPGAQQFNAGFTTQACWARTRLKNSGQLTRSVILVSEDLKTDFIDLFAYSPSGELRQRKTTGDELSYATRGYDYPGFGFRFDLDPGEELDVLLRLQSRTPIEADLRLYSPESFGQQMAEVKWIQTLFVGAMASILLFNFLLFLTSGESIYLLYCLFQISSSLALGVGFGNAYGFLWPNSPRINSSAINIFANLTPALGLIFMKQYLNVKENLPAAMRPIRVLVALFLLTATLGALWSQMIFVAASYVLMLGGSLTIIGVPTWLALRGDRYARLYLLAWAPVGIAVGSFFLQRFGIRMPVMPRAYGIALGCIWEAVFLSLCLGKKFMISRKQELAYLRRIQDEERAAHEAQTMAEIQKAQKQNSDREALANRNLVRLICHDLATPLSVIINYAEILSKDEKLSPVHALILKRISKAADHQHAIITHVREFEALQASKIEIKNSEVCLRETLGVVAEMMQHQLEARKMQLLLPEGQGPLAVVAERKSLIYSVLGNLVSNAIKFSEDAEVITCRVRETGDAIELEIEDHGIGMSAKLLQHIFDFNTATTRPGLRGERGTGFGLPLAKTYLELYGASLKVRSRCRDEHPHDHGTVFTLAFKRASGRCSLSEPL